jgi:hypothetical protein
MSARDETLLWRLLALVPCAGQPSVRASLCADVRAVRSDTARRILRGVLHRQITLFRHSFKRTKRQLDDNIMDREQLLCELLAAMSFRACLVTKGQVVAVAALRL